MHLGYVIIYVRDVIETINFYEKAFGIKSQFIDDSKMYAEMQTGKSVLSFVDEKLIKDHVDFEENRKNKKSAGAEIAFIANNVEKQFKQAIDAGAINVVEPVKKPWGQIVSYVKDNNGFLVEICSVIEK
jgi:lactoylglutathione lyase